MKQVRGHGRKVHSLLSRDERVRQAMKIIGSTARRADVEKVVDRMVEHLKCLRSRESMKHRQYARRYGAALRKVVHLTKGAPNGFFGIPKELLRIDDALRSLELYSAICESWEQSKWKRSAMDKLYAAQAALALCKTYHIRPVTSDGSKFRNLAAVLYGDPGADLEHQCAAVLKKQEPERRTFRPDIVDLVDPVTRDRWLSQKQQRKR